MNDLDSGNKKEIFSKVLKAGKRTYFFDVNASKNNTYFITITESKKFTEIDGSFSFKKQKMFLYEEDFKGFTDVLTEVTDFVAKQKEI